MAGSTQARKQVAKQRRILLVSYNTREPLDGGRTTCADSYAMRGAVHRPGEREIQCECRKTMREAEEGKEEDEAHSRRS
ncbi:hypothetical protein VTO73DRAFT_4713 [Trametes versicolor]